MSKELIDLLLSPDGVYIGAVYVAVCALAVGAAVIVLEVIEGSYPRKRQGYQPTQGTYPLPPPPNMGSSGHPPKKDTVEVIVHRFRLDRKEANMEGGIREHD
jgi:hypothetical protein